MKLEKRTDTSGLYRRQNVAFSGLDFTDGAEEGTLRDSAGISSARWPVLSTRAGRGQYSDITLTAPCAIYAFDKLCVIDDGVFYYGGEEMGYVDMGEKQFAVVGKKLCIWPDKKYLNLADPDNPVWGTLEASVTALSGSATFTDGTLTISCNPSLGEQQEKVANLSTSNYKFYYRVYDTVSFDPATGTWTTTGSTTTPVYVAGRDNAAEFVGKYSILDTDGYLQRRSNSTASAGVIEHFNTDGYYAKITSWEMTADTDSQQVFRLRYNVYDASLENETLTDLFSVGDGVTISGATEEDNNKTAVIRDITEETLTFDSNIFIEGTDAACVTVAREVPDLDFICEWNNRLWGVGDKTLYGSMQGRAENFNVFDGLSDDSYAVEVGTDMDFTAICRYSDSLLCWKENVLHKLLGTAPSDFCLYTYDIAGVQAGSDKSLQIINEVLYYKGQAGVYAYSGGRPQLISNAFGTRQYHAAVGGADGWRYYLSMRDAQEDAHLFVYDTRRGLWLREDDTAAVQFAELSGTVYMLTEGGEILLPEAGGDERVTWYAELSPFTETVHNRKIYSKLLLRLTLDEGAHASVEVARDGGLWHKIWTGHRTGTVVVPVIPNRCDKFAVRLSGAGGCAVESMIRQFRTGGEV